MSCIFGISEKTLTSTDNTLKMITIFEPEPQPEPEPEPESNLLFDEIEIKRIYQHSELDPPVTATATGVYLGHIRITEIQLWINGQNVLDHTTDTVIAPSWRDPSTPDKAIDKDFGTMWHTQASNAGDHTPGAIYQEKPYIQIQLSNTYFINSIQSLVIYSDYQNSFLDTLIGCQVFSKKEIILYMSLQ